MSSVPFGITRTRQAVMRTRDKRRRATTLLGQFPLLLNPSPKGPYNRVLVFGRSHLQKAKNVFRMEEWKNAAFSDGAVFAAAAKNEEGELLRGQAPDLGHPQCGIDAQAVQRAVHDVG